MFVLPIYIDFLVEFHLNLVQEKLEERSKTYQNMLEVTLDRDI